MSEPNIKLVAFCGSLRKGSFNRLALQAFIERLPQGASVETIEIGDWPLYNADVQAQGFPDKVQAAQKAMLEADGVVFASPEYNYSVSGVLKNAIDWLSRMSPSLTIWPCLKPTLITSPSTRLRTSTVSNGCTVPRPLR